jgi:hypothetical protein
MVEITANGYGFGRDWTLVMGDKRFFLGQDVKFCHRVLGMDPSYIIDKIGSDDICEPSVNKRLAEFIIESLGVNDSMESWDLCAN